MPTILLIEDEQDLRENLVDTLTFEGFDLLTAENGVQGIELAMAHEPDLILSDVMMPEMDGWEVLAALQANDHTRCWNVVCSAAALHRLFDTSTISPEQFSLMRLI